MILGAILTKALIFGVAAIATVATVATTVSLVVQHWNNVCNWLKRAICKVEEIVHHTIYGTKVFMKKISEAVKEISKHYSQDRFGRWKETVVSRQMNQHEIPEEIIQKANIDNKEIDVTNELKLHLK